MSSMCAMAVWWNKSKRKIQMFARKKFFFILPTDWFRYCKSTGTGQGKKAKWEASRKTPIAVFANHVLKTVTQWNLVDLPMFLNLWENIKLSEKRATVSN